MIKHHVKDYFSGLAPKWDYWRNKNAYYHNHLHSLVRGVVPPNRQVLEIGCGTGDLLASLTPRRGVGLNFSEDLTHLAKQKYPPIDFFTVDVDKVHLPSGFVPDYVVLSNMLDYVYDIADLMGNLRPLLADHSTLIVITNNPLWAPLLRLGSRLKLRVPESHRNFITNKDIGNILQVEGFAVIEEALTLPVPVRIPLIGPFINALLPDVPILRFLSSVQYLIARRRAPRPPLSCSVVVPCHNEEDNISECIRRTPTMGTQTEILVVDDGSTDGTRAQVQKAMKEDSRVRLIAADKNQGKASAVHAGFESAMNDVVMILDADMTVRPEDLPRFFLPLQNGNADFVNGTRLIYPMEGHAMRLFNFLGNKAFCFLTSWILRQRVSDTLCGTKAFLKRDAGMMPHKKQERWGDFELLFGAARLRLRMIEVPIHYYERRAGKSKMRVVYDGMLFLKACLLGWHMLRFPNSSPWMDKTSSLEGWHEVK